MMGTLGCDEGLAVEILDLSNVLASLEIALDDAAVSNISLLDAALVKEVVSLPDAPDQSEPRSVEIALRGLVRNAWIARHVLLRAFEAASLTHQLSVLSILMLNFTHRARPTSAVRPAQRLLCMYGPNRRQKPARRSGMAGTVRRTAAAGNGRASFAWRRERQLMPRSLCTNFGAVSSRTDLSAFLSSGASRFEN